MGGGKRLWGLKCQRWQRSWGRNPDELQMEFSSCHLMLLPSSSNPHIDFFFNTQCRFSGLLHPPLLLFCIASCSLPPTFPSQRKYRLPWCAASLYLCSVLSDIIALLQSAFNSSFLPSHALHLLFLLCLSFTSFRGVLLRQGFCV